MAVRKVGGHGVTSVLGQHGGQAAFSAQPNFQHNSGSAGYAGPVKRAGGGLPGGNGGKKKASPQAPNKSVSKLL